MLKRRIEVAPKPVPVEHTASSSSWLSRAQMRALVSLETKLGIEPKYAKYILFGLVLVSLLLVSILVLSVMEEDSGFDLGSSMIFGEDESSSSSSASFQSESPEDSGEDEEEEKGGGKGGRDDEEEEEDEGDNAASAADDDEEEDEPKKKVSAIKDDSGKFKDNQLKRFTDKDKTLMKFFTKQRKESEITSHFHTLSDLYSELKLVKSVVLGKTHEHKSITGYEIGLGPKKILIVAGERGNEWLGSMSLTYFATRLIQKYALTPQVTSIVNELTLLIVPVLNPDGLAYHKSDWFMNRAIDPATKKHGVDVSSDYLAFSQLESTALKQYAEKHVSDLYSFVNIRCCAGSVSIPKSALCPSSESVQMKVANNVAAAMGKGGKFKYPIRTSDLQNDSPSFGFRELGLSLSFSLEAHSSSTDEVLVTSQNVTMGLLELSKFVVNDWPSKQVLGGGGVKPCGGGGGGGKSAKKVSSEDDDEEEEDGGGDAVEEESSEDEEDDQTEKKTSKKTNAVPAEEEEEEEEEEQKHSTVRAGDNEVDLSVSFAQKRNLPIPEVTPENTFLYFAYGPDMLYDVLLKAGLTTAWKISNAKLSGYTFDYTYHSNKKWKSGVADMVKSPHSVMYGVVWRLDLNQMGTLLQWQSASTPDSPLAQKQVSVESKTGEVYSCITFYVQRKMKGEDILEKYHRFNPSRQYRNCVLKGAKANHLPLDYIEHKLKSRSLGPLFTDKVGSMHHRNPIIENVCDPLDV